MLFSVQGSRTFSILSYNNNNRSNTKHVLKQRKVVPPLPAMNGGDGDLSYSQNSAYQRGAVEAAEEIIKSEVVKQFSVKKLCGFPTQTSFRIADFGCSTGPNTFLAVQIIINAIIKKLETESQNSKLPEFQVFFNDNVFNDFNTLFSSLPPERNYYASGVPGSFYIPLFPKASLHFAHSSSALCWLSELPKEITDRSSRAWNKGKISYTESKEEVFEAYSGQFCRDFERFLNARADELVSGGLMELLVPGVPDYLDQSHSTTASEIDLLGSCLMDMANNVNTLACPNEHLRICSCLSRGKFDESMVDEFNMPLYYTHPKELKGLLENNKNFSIERMEILHNSAKHVTMPDPESRAMYFRATLEQVLVKHFPAEIMDELFDRYADKIADSSLYLKPDVQRSIFIFVLLKRLD